EYPGTTEALREVAHFATVREGAAIHPGEVRNALAGIEVGGIDSLAARASARALLFARECFRDKVFPVWRVALWNPTGVLQLDRVAQRHLELTESTMGDPSATLLGVIDRTCSPGGARLLRRRIVAPLTDVSLI